MARPQGLIPSLFIVSLLIFDLSGQEPSNCSPARANGIQGIKASADGAYYVMKANGQLERRDAEGNRRWVVDFSALDGAAPLYPNDFAVLENGDILAAGVVGGITPMGVVYRLSGESLEIDQIAEYPGMDPFSLAIAADGTVYLLALSATQFNLIAGGRLPLRTLYRERICHELDAEGQIVRSIMPVSTVPNSLEELTAFTNEQFASKLLFSPGGEAYIAQTDRGLLHQVDLEQGERVETFKLASRPEGTTYTRFFSFLGNGEMMYTAIVLDERDGILDHYVSRLDLRNGSQREFMSLGATRLLLGAYFDASSDTIVGVDLVGEDLGRHTVSVKRRHSRR